MSREYVSKNVDEIFEGKEFDFPLNSAMSAAWILGNFKGLNLKVLDMRKTTSLADYFILASATNSTQAKSMADEIVVQLKRKGMTVLSKEGFNEEADWILLDLGDIIIHIFQETSRDIYDLDNLWSTPTISIPNEYYHSSDEATGVEEEKGYF